jgi:hypothetical protein
VPFASFHTIPIFSMDKTPKPTTSKAPKVPKQLGCMCKCSCSSSLYATFLMVSILDILPPHLWHYDEGFDAVKVTEEELNDKFKCPDTDLNTELKAYTAACFVQRESEKRLGFQFPLALVKSPHLRTLIWNHKAQFCSRLGIRRIQTLMKTQSMTKKRFSPSFL